MPSVDSRLGSSTSLMNLSLRLSQVVWVTQVNPSDHEFIAGGFLMLGCYGLVVNLVKWDFSRLLGVYVAIFAVVSILWGRFILEENIPPSTWLGLSVIVVGGLIIQSGHK